MSPREKWQHWHPVTRASLVFGLIAGIWAGLTAAMNTTERWLLPRREHEHFRDSLEAAQILHDVRDSARQETVIRALRYNACLTQTRGNERPCSHLYTP
jgi:hypothetical protein